MASAVSSGTLFRDGRITLGIFTQYRREKNGIEERHRKSEGGTLMDRND